MASPYADILELMRTAQLGGSGSWADPGQYSNANATVLDPVTGQPRKAYVQDGYNFMPIYGQDFAGSSRELGQDVMPEFTGFTRAKLGTGFGDKYGVYDKDGNFVREDEYKAPDAAEKFTKAATLALIAAVGGGALMTGMGALGGAAGGAGGGGAAGAGGIGATGSLPTGAFLGEGIASGIPAWDAALSAALPAGSAGATLSKAALDGTNVFGANSAPGALNIDALVAASPGAQSAAAVGDIAKSLGYTGTSTGSSLLDKAKSVLGNTNALGGAASLLGAAGGGGGGGGGGGEFDPFGVGQYLPGLFQQTQSLLQDPAAKNAGQRLQSLGTSLLDFTPAGNGYQMFANRRI